MSRESVTRNLSRDFSQPIRIGWEKAQRETQRCSYSWRSTLSPFITFDGFPYQEETAQYIKDFGIIWRYGVSDDNSRDLRVKITTCRSCMHAAIFMSAPVSWRWFHRILKMSPLELARKISLFTCDFMMETMKLRVFHMWNGWVQTFYSASIEKNLNFIRKMWDAI